MTITRGSERNSEGTVIQYWPASFLVLASLSAISGCENGGDIADESLAAAASSSWNELPLTPNTFADQASEYRVDAIDILLDSGGELEYKLNIEKGSAIVYEWNALNLTNPQELWSEFHGHTERVGDAQGDLMFYRTAFGNQEKGTLIAPFTGIHGWYLRNDSNESITIRLDVSGYYTLVEP